MKRGVIDRKKKNEGEEGKEREELIKECPLGRPTIGKSKGEVRLTE